MKKHTLQSAILAVALVFGISATMTVGHSLVAPAAAQAGVIGKIKGAAKTVGKGAAAAGKTVGKGAATVGNNVKRAAVVAGKAAYRSPIGVTGKTVARAARRAVSR